jgi:hypothetical protein
MNAQMSRTTLTLDPDVEALLHTLMRERGISFKVAVNSALRRGLGADRPRVDVSFRTFDMGVPRVDLTHAIRVVGELEDAEITHELGRGR